MATQFPDPRAAAFTFTGSPSVEGGLKPSGALGDPNRAFRGINQSTYTAYRTGHGLHDQDVALASDVEVAAIYNGYWTRFRCPEIAPRSGALAIIHFDTGFNGGAVDVAERTIGELPGERDATLNDAELANLLEPLLEPGMEDAVCAAYLQNRLDRYRELAGWPAAGHTWTKRLNDLAAYVGITWRTS